MALRSIYNQFSKEIDVPSIQTYNLIVNKGSKSISHAVDTAGNYTITNQDGRTVLQFDNNANLVDGVLLQSIIANTDEITMVANNLNTLQTTVKNLQDSGGQPQGLASVLNIGHDANAQSISNVSILEINNYVDIAGVYISANNNSIMVSSLSSESITCNELYVSNVNVSVNTLITNMQNQINSLISYNTELKSLILSLSQSLNLQKSDNSGPFDYSSLLN